MRRLWALPALLILTLLLTGCTERIFGYKAVSEWSRGRQLGLSIQEGPVALDVAAGGQPIVLVWTASPGRDMEVLHLLALDSQGNVLVDQDLPVTVTEPSALHIALAGDGRFHLTWVQDRGDTQGLHHAVFTLDGELVSPPQVLSAPGFLVNGHQIALLPSEELLVVWATREGLYAARLAEGGMIQSELLESPGAGQLGFQVDDAGLVHVAWQQSRSASERTLSYTTLDPTTLSFAWPMYLDTELLRAGPSFSGGGQQMEGPVVSLDQEQILVSWTVSEPSSSRGDAFYVTLVPGEVEELFPRRIALPSSYPPDYAAASGTLPYRQLAPTLPPTAVAYRTDVLGTPATIAGQRDEVPLALSASFRTDWSAEFQPALVVFAEGKAAGYQAVAFTRFPSLFPALAVDGERNLYLAWVDIRGSERPVYLASTAPSLRGAWDRIGTGDLLVALEQLSGRIVSALGVILPAISWIILPGFFLVVMLFIFREDSLYETRGWILLYVITGMHWAGKFLFSADILTTLPRLKDLPLIFPLSTLLAPGTLAYLPNQASLPQFLAPLVPFIVPSLTLATGALVSRLVYLKRVKEPHAVPAYAILAVVDVFLAIQIYALTFFDPMRY